MIIFFIHILLYLNSATLYLIFLLTPEQQKVAKDFALSEIPLIFVLR